MPKFRFAGQPVLQLKQQQLRIARLDRMRAAALLEAKRQERVSVWNQLEEIGQNLAANWTPAHADFIARLHNRLETIAGEMESQEREVEIKRELEVELERAVEMLVKLRDTKLAEFRLREDRKQESTTQDNILRNWAMDSG